MSQGQAVLKRSASHWGAFSAEVRAGRVVGICPFETDPRPSPIIEGIPDGLYAADRVAEPCVRKSWLEKGWGADREQRGAEPFVPVSWGEALDLVARELKRVKESFGNPAIYGGSYGWASAGSFHRANFQLYRFLNQFGGFTEKYDSYSFAAGTVIMPHVIGSRDPVVGRTTSWASMVGNTHLMMMFGGMPLKNAQVEYGGVARHVTADWLKRIKEAGAEFVSVALVKDDTPDFLGAEWLAPRPNTDTALMLGLAHTLVAENRHDRAFLDRYCTGFEKFRAYLMGETDGQPKDADWASGITEIPTATIRNLACRMATKRTMITVTWSLQRGDHGEQPYWMAVVLAAMLGQIGLPGGGFGFGYSSESSMGSPRHWIPVPTLHYGTNPTGSGIPVARISDMLLNPGATYSYDGQSRTYPHIRLVYWCGGDPFHHHQDINRLIRALHEPETIIVHEPWWSPLARFADIVLPATTPLERNDIGASSRDRFLLAMEQAVAPVGSARSDHDIFAALARRLGFREVFTEGRNEKEWLRHLYDVSRQQAARVKVAMPDFDTFWEQGYVEIPEPEKPYLLLEDFRRDPAAYPLKTPSGKIEVFSERIAGFGYDDCPGHPVWLEPCEWLGSEKAKRYPLHLLSNQPRTRLHSQLDQARVSRASKIKGREPIWIHPRDASARGIKDGNVVRVFNDRGQILAGAVVTEFVRPGLVQLATGARYDPLEPGRIGTLDKHGNANVLTTDKGTSALGQAPASHSALVEIERYEGPLPEITAFLPPPMVQRSRPAKV